MCFQNHNWYVYQQNKLDRPDLRSSIMIYIHILLFAFLLSFYFVSVVHPERHTIAADQPAFNGRQVGDP